MNTFCIHSVSITKTRAELRTLVYRLSFRTVKLKVLRNQGFNPFFKLARHPTHLFH